MLIWHDITQQAYGKKTFKLQLIYLKKRAAARIHEKKPTVARIANKNLSQI